MDQECLHLNVTKQQYNPMILRYICNLLNIKTYGSPTTIGGRIATNIKLETDKGELIIRFYPKEIPEKLETGHPLFEIEALKFFTDHGIKVPIPLKMKDKFLLETENQIIFAYFFLPGTPIKQSELSIAIAKNIGEFLSAMLNISVLFSPSCLTNDIFLNSFEHCLRITEIVENKYLELKTLDIWSIMKKHTFTHKDILSETPKGIVHADFFFENILINGEGKVIGLLDFGDAYYGNVLHDVVIGGMESCILPGEVWDLNILASFLKETCSFLNTYSIAFEQFYETLKVDSFRFALYTVSYTASYEEIMDSNNYIKRYKKLLNEDFRRTLAEIYMECTKT